MSSVGAAVFKYHLLPIAVAQAAQRQPGVLFSRIDYRADVNTLEQHPVDAPIMNDFTPVAWKTQHPLAID